MIIDRIEISVDKPFTWDHLMIGRIAVEQLVNRFALALLVSQIDFGTPSLFVIRLVGAPEAKDYQVGPQYIHAKIDFNQLELETDVLGSLTNFIADTIIQFFKFHGASAATTVNCIRSQLLKERDDAKFFLKAKRLERDNFRIEPFLVLKGHFDANTQLYARVTDLEKSLCADRMIIEGCTLEILSCTVFTLENGFLLTSPVHNQHARWLYDRGFRFPIKVDLTSLTYNEPTGKS